MQRIRFFGTVLVCPLAVLALQGCLFTRVLETRSQLCDEPPARVSVTQEPGWGLRVIFEEPTLTEQDIVWIIGFEPTRTGGGNTARELIYEARPLDRPLDRTSGLLLRLSFTQIRGEYRLSEVEVPEKLNAILPRPLIDAAVKVVCKAQIVVVPPSTTLDLAEVDTAMLPTRDALQQLLGLPTANVAGSHEASYRYGLVPCKPASPMIANLRFVFGPSGDLRRADLSDFRHSAKVDLVSPRPTATIELH